MPERVQYDVVVVGYGCAGGVAAVEAADAGARVLLVEKMPRLGGLTILSSGYARVATDAAGATAYLMATNGGRVDPGLAEALGQGMTEVPAYLRYLGRAVDAKLHMSLGDAQAAYEIADLYDWPGREALGWAGIESVPGFTGYPWAHQRTRGEALMRTLEANVAGRAIDVWLEAPAQRLLVEDGAVVGVVVEREGVPVEVGARGGVVLTCGGFEFNQRMLQDFMELPALYPIGHPGNTGDGVRMAQEVGAALWHMWHTHSSYGFRVEGHPVAIRNHLGGSRNPARKLAWILVDQQGRRFMNELPPAPQDTAARPLAHLDVETGRFDRVPAWMVFDDAARQLGPVGQPVASVPEHRYAWSADNLAEVERGLILQAPTIAALAARAGLPAESFSAAIRDWNAAVAAGCDAVFGRPPGSLVPVATPPFYAAQVWPILSNTQGGPRHDAQQRVLDPADRPIPGLYAAGELGSFFGHIYLLGGNLSEGIVGGRIAGRRAAQGLDRAAQGTAEPVEGTR
jgi:succinate dehydrogenase/fumarate reductase flavoprotein subunit